MTVWSCIDGTENTTWEYVPLGIVEDLKKVPGALNAMLPGTMIDDTAWTKIISSYRHNQLDRQEKDAAIRIAA